MKLADGEPAKDGKHSGLLSCMRQDGRHWVRPAGYLEERNQVQTNDHQGKGNGRPGAVMGRERNLKQAVRGGGRAEEWQVWVERRRVVVGRGDTFSLVCGVQVLLRVAGEGVYFGEVVQHVPR